MDGWLTEWLKVRLGEGWGLYDADVCTRVIVGTTSSA